MINSRVYQQVESSLKVLSSSLGAKGLCIALSGGVDSVVLLHLCREYANKHNVILQAVYVNHACHSTLRSGSSFVNRFVKHSMFPLLQNRLLLLGKPVLA